MPTETDSLGKTPFSELAPMYALPIMNALKRIGIREPKPEEIFVTSEGTIIFKDYQTDLYIETQDESDRTPNDILDGRFVPVVRRRV